jgi:hypothetical protein
MTFNQAYVAAGSIGRARRRSLQVWLEIGGKCYYMKSIWERNIARHLEWLKLHKQIREWEYEAKTFVFDVIKFGNRTYTPDFRITENSGKQHWLEVKEWMDPTPKTKLRRAVHPPEAIHKILDCLGLPSRAPPIAATMPDMDDPCIW